ncbi:MAG: DUF6929 family protein [Candidatus Methylumidiphilus sp.]
MAAPLVCVRDAALSATVLSRRELRYAEGADAALDRPGHVRAGSSLAWFGRRIAVVQDDANFVALFDPDSGQVGAWTLPAGAGGRRQFDERRGNKPHKLDLEACFSAPTGLVALGSGSSPQRETLALIAADGQARLFPAPGLYARLHAAQAFSGGELNVEGAVFVDGVVRLFNRGNGAWRDGVPPRNASCDILWAEFAAYLQGGAAPALRNIVEYDLGALDGAPLTFTDASATASGLLYTAAAEASPDAVTDGVVTGSAVGVLAGATGRWIELRDADGALLAEKVEGICPVAGRDGIIYVAVDADDPDRPTMLCEVALRGPWFQPASFSEDSAQ